MYNLKNTYIWFGHINLSVINLTSLHEPNMIYDTAENPVLLMCNDYGLWVCKHSRHPSMLFNEFIGANFASIWKIPTPETSLITVLPEHIPQKLAPISFTKTCFGSKYIENSKEIEKSVYCMFDDPSFRAKISNRTDFLKIALYDMWLANEDRNHNNSNLLLDYTDNSETKFTVIDHGTIFNTSSLHRGLYQINVYDSILNTPITPLLFNKGSRFNNVLENLIENFYLCVQNCEQNLVDILSNIPDNWALDTNNLERLLRESIFTKQWLNETVDNFRGLVQITI